MLDYSTFSLLTPPPHFQAHFSSLLQPLLPHFPGGGVSTLIPSPSIFESISPLLFNYSQEVLMLPKFFLKKSFCLIVVSCTAWRNHRTETIFFLDMNFFVLVFASSSSTFLPFLSFLMCQPPSPPLLSPLPQPLARKKPGLKKNPPIYRKTSTLISANKVCSEMNKALRHFLSPFLLHGFFFISRLYHPISMLLFCLSTFSFFLSLLRQKLPPSFPHSAEEGGKDG